MLNKIHTDAATMIVLGGLMLQDAELEKNIGKLARFISPTCGTQHGLFEIVGVQKMWGYNAEGEYVPDMHGYRLMASKDVHRFGTPALPSKITIIG